LPIVIPDFLIWHGVVTTTSWHLRPFLGIEESDTIIGGTIKRIGDGR
jgi:hypothetical protein